MAIKYASQIQGGSLSSKLKKVFESNSKNNLIQSNNMISTSAVIQKNGFSGNFVKHDSIQLNN